LTRWAQASSFRARSPAQLLLSTIRSPSPSLARALDTTLHRQDLKIGTQTYAADAGPKKQARMKRKAEGTTSESHGIRLVGVRLPSTPLKHDSFEYLGYKVRLRTCRSRSCAPMRSRHRGAHSRMLPPLTTIAHPPRFPRA
jgi:hypothetical protein